MQSRVRLACGGCLGAIDASAARCGAKKCTARAMTSFIEKSARARRDGDEALMGASCDAMATLRRYLYLLYHQFYSLNRSFVRSRLGLG